MLRYEDTLRTVYEFKIPVQGLGVDSLPNRMAMGFGMCLNDGDTEAGEGGQKGWTGWGPVLDCVRQELAGVRPDHHARRVCALKLSCDLLTYPVHTGPDRCERHRECRSDGQRVFEGGHPRLGARRLGCHPDS